MAHDDDAVGGNGLAPSAARIARRSTIATILLGVGVLLQLSACERSDAPTGDAVVVAKVNTDEITLGRLKAAIKRAALVDPAPLRAMPDVAMDTLIRQSLAAEQARKLKLDKTPEVRMSVDEAAREILANAYFEHLAAQAEKPNSEEIHAYYVAHPELFRDRRLYSLKEIALPGDAQSAINEILSRARGMDEIAHQLRRRGIEFQVTSSIRAPETLPLDMLPRLSGARLGDVVSYHGDGVAYVAQVIGILNAPVGEDAAHERITKFLEHVRAKELLAQEDKRLRSDARIEIGSDLKKLIEQPSVSSPTVTMEEIHSPPQDFSSQLSASTRLSIVQ